MKMTRRTLVSGLTAAKLLSAEDSIAKPTRQKLARNFFPTESEPNPQRKLTARQVVEQIQKYVGIPWRSETVDTFKIGDPDTLVSGIATTFTATLDVLQRAAAANINLIIVHEPTFYGNLDTTKELEDDEVLSAKQNYIKEKGLVIWRFHDHWHSRKPDGILSGITTALGWETYQNPGTPSIFTLPRTNLSALASQIKARLEIRTLRVVGDAQMRLRKVSMLLGAGGARAQIKLLQRDDVEALLIGETTEWTTVEYVRDAVKAGKNKALIILGHVPSEEMGMEECARWLKTFLPGMSIDFIPAGEPFWAPR
jgi:putative NIF3 family GTP cyclohydrolase 1 type 2